ncbi:MAG: hypothetical protein LBF21_00025 [Puniceicoccales bacterium]|nr:hypothetical protein [Puniceicoccales bacterium]
MGLLRTKSIGLCCACALSLASVGANPILSEDKSMFQLNIPAEIQKRLSAFIAATGGQEAYRAFPFKAKQQAGMPLCKKLPQDFSKMVVAMNPCARYSLAPEKIRDRLSGEKLVRFAKTLLDFNEEKLYFPIALASAMDRSLSYFLYPSDPDCPSEARRLAALRRWKGSDPDLPLIDEYMSALNDITLQSLRPVYGMKE